MFACSGQTEQPRARGQVRSRLGSGCERLAGSGPGRGRTAARVQVCLYSVGSFVFLVGILVPFSGLVAVSCLSSNTCPVLLAAVLIKTPVGQYPGMPGIPGLLGSNPRAAVMG